MVSGVEIGVGDNISVGIALEFELCHFSHPRSFDGEIRVQRYINQELKINFIKSSV